MHVNKKTYWLQLPYLDEIFKRILLKSRVNIFNIFLIYFWIILNSIRNQKF